MDVNKDLFEYIKQIYVENINHSEEMARKYKNCLDNYSPRFGERALIFDMYIRHQTANAIFKDILKDLELLEDKLC